MRIIKKIVISFSSVIAIMANISTLSVNASVQDNPSPPFIRGKWSYSSSSYYRTTDTEGGYANSVYMNGYYLYGITSYNWTNPENANVATNQFQYISTLVNGTYAGWTIPFTYYRLDNYLNINGRHYSLE